MTQDLSPKEIQLLVEERALAIAKAAELPDVKAEEKLDPWFVIDRLRRNRVGDADLFVTLFRGRYAYVPEWDKWLYWSGHHWDIDLLSRRALADIEQVCAAYQNAIVETGQDDKSPLSKTMRSRIDKLRTAAGREEVLECATSIYNPPVVAANDLDQQHYHLATPSGVVDLRTGECSPGKPEQYMLNAIPTEWTGLDTPCPNFQHYLLSCMNGDQEMADFIVRLLGYGLLGDKFLNIWAIMYGPLSRNGKDTLMNTIKGILGDQIHARMGVSLLIEQKFPRDPSRPEPELLALRGARIAYASEANARQSLDQAKIKDLTGGGFITARGINDKYMTSWKQSALMILLTNYVPKMDTDDDGFNARTLFIEWPVKFVPNPTREWERQIDRHMGKKLEAERSGILALMVRGCMDVLANGLRIPEKVLRFTEAQMAAQDDIGRFLKECCLIEEPPTGSRDYETRTPAADLLKVCNWWCKKILGNSYPYTPKKFTPALEKKGIFTKKSSVMYYLGVVVKPEILEEYNDDLLEEQEKNSRRKS